MELPVPRSTGRADSILHFIDEIHDRGNSLLNEWLGFRIILVRPAKNVAPDRHTTIAMGGDDRSAIYVFCDGFRWKNSVISLGEQPKIWDLHLHGTPNRAIALTVGAMAGRTVVDVEVETGEPGAGLTDATRSNQRQCHQ